jgi:electron transfer flavoprotein beta subunit
MKIAVLVKAVPDSEAVISVQGDGESLEVEEKYELNFFDELAVEEAVRIKEALGDVEVVAVTYGPSRGMEAIRKAVAMGADEAVFVEETEDPWDKGFQCARVLSSVVQSLGCDMVLCGRRATDDEGAMVGPMVAELLGWPHVGAALEVAISEDRLKATVLREWDGGHERLECPLPALITTQKGLNEPRVPTIQGVMRGMKLKPNRVDASTVELLGEEPRGRWERVRFMEPPKRPPVRFIEGDDPSTKAGELVRILREEIKVL